MKRDDTGFQGGLDVRNLGNVVDAEVRGDVLPQVVRAEDNAIDAVRSYIQRLEQENAELRAQLGVR